MGVWRDHLAEVRVVLWIRLQRRLGTFDLPMVDGLVERDRRPSGGMGYVLTPRATASSQTATSDWKVRRGGRRRA